MLLLLFWQLVRSFIATNCWHSWKVRAEGFREEALGEVLVGGLRSRKLQGHVLRPL